MTDQVRALATSGAPAGTPCSLHSLARDRNLTVERHHVVPVDWQTDTFKPVVEPYPGADTAGRGHLWDARWVYLSPTCHHNLHLMLGDTMRAYHELGDLDGAAARAVTVGWRRSKEWGVARLGINRFLAVGGSLDWLAANGHWGYA